MWPFSELKDLRLRIEFLENRLSSLQGQVAGLHERLKPLEHCDNEVMANLEALNIKTHFLQGRVEKVEQGAVWIRSDVTLCKAEPLDD